MLHVIGWKNKCMGLFKYIVDQVLPVCILIFTFSSFYRPAHALVVWGFFYLALTSWNDNSSGTREKELCRHGTIKQTDFVVCLFQLSTAMYLWRNSTQKCIVSCAVCYCGLLEHVDASVSFVTFIMTVLQCFLFLWNGQTCLAVKYLIPEHRIAER